MSSPHSSFPNFHFVQKADATKAIFCELQSLDGFDDDRLRVRARSSGARPEEPSSPVRLRSLPRAAAHAGTELVVTG